MSDEADFYDKYERDEERDDDACPNCQGEGRVPTMDYESYFGASYKTCPICHERPGDGPLS